METIEYRDVIDKSEWLRGEWDTEYDKKQWLDLETGYPCLVKRSPTSGGLCGYVGIPEGHPANRGGPLWNTAEEMLEVHGGITFGGECSEGPEATSICHIVQKAEDDKVFWYGFDCGHGGDFSPLHRLFDHRGDTYKNVAYVEAETLKLAKQLKEMEERNTK